MSFERNSCIKFRDRGCIADIINKIDQAQKEAFIEKECDTCERSLLQKIYNTRPLLSTYVMVNRLRWMFLVIPSVLLTSVLKR